MPPALETWHNIIRSKNASGLNDLIATDAVFYSPLVHTPQTGRERVVQYLTAAAQVLLNDSFHYVRELIELNEAMLEFKVVIVYFSKNLRIGMDWQWNLLQHNLKN